MVDHAGPGTLAQVALDSWLTPQALGAGWESPGQIVDPVDPQTRARVTRECWWISQSLGPEPESPGTPCRPHMLSEQGPSRQGYLVDTAGTGSRAQVTRTIWGSHWTWDTGPVARTNGLPSGPADTGPSRPGERVDP